MYCCTIPDAGSVQVKVEQLAASMITMHTLQPLLNSIIATKHHIMIRQRNIILQRETRAPPQHRSFGCVSLLSHLPFRTFCKQAGVMNTTVTGVRTVPSHLHESGMQPITRCRSISTPSEDQESRKPPPPQRKPGQTSTGHLQI